MFKVISFILLFCFMMVGATFEVEGEDSTSVSRERIAGELLGGVAGIVASVYIVEEILNLERASPWDVHHKKISQGKFIRNLVIEDTMIALCSSIGVYFVGIIGNETGTFSDEMMSFGSTLGSSALGTLLVFAGCVFPELRSNVHDITIKYYGEEDPWSCGTVPFNMGLTLIGAVIGFNATRNHILRDESENRAAQAAPVFRLDLVKVSF